MSSLAILIDFGSTFTKLVAVDLERAELLGRLGGYPCTLCHSSMDGVTDLRWPRAERYRATACRTGCDDSQVAIALRSSGERRRAISPMQSGSAARRTPLRQAPNCASR